MRKLGWDDGDLDKLKSRGVPASRIVLVLLQDKTVTKDVRSGEKALGKL